MTKWLIDCNSARRSDPVLTGTSQGIQAVENDWQVERTGMMAYKHLDGYIGHTVQALSG